MFDGLRDIVLQIEDLGELDQGEGAGQGFVGVLLVAHAPDSLEVLFGDFVVFGLGVAVRD